VFCQEASVVVSPPVDVIDSGESADVFPRLIHGVAGLYGSVGRPGLIVGL
jgi:hypothetical protein